MADRCVRSWVCGGLIGAGAFGSVNLAVDNETGELFAIKSTECRGWSSPPAAAASTGGGGGAGAALVALENELSILQSLQASPRIVKCLGSAWSTSAQSGQPVRSVFLEYMPGGSVADLMAKLGGKLDESLVRIYTRGILEGLDFLHNRGIVHCDIKGKNVLVGSSGVKLADFGAAKRLGCQQQLPVIVRGTPLWMAPEVIRQEEQGTASDIWSLGCTVLEMITGRAPWGDVKHTFSALYRIGCSDELPELPGWLSDQGKDFVMNCLRRDPGQRWSSSQLLQHPFVATATAPPPPSAAPPPPVTSSCSSLTAMDSARISKLLAGMPVATEEEAAESRRRLCRPKLEVCGNWDQGQGNDPFSPGSAGGKWIVVRSPQGRNNWNLPDPFNLLSDFEESGEDGEVIDPCEEEVEMAAEEAEEAEEAEQGIGGSGDEEEEIVGIREFSPDCSCSTSSCWSGLVFCYEFGGRKDQLLQRKFKLGSLLQPIGSVYFSDRESDSWNVESWQGSVLVNAKKRMRRKRRASRSGGWRRRGGRKRVAWKWMIAGGDNELGLLLFQAPDPCVECKSRKLALFLLLFDSLSRRRKRRRENKVNCFSNRKNSLSLSSPLFLSNLSPCFCFF